MFERFTEGARAVVVEAQDLALELRSPVITPVYLLYGCAEVRDDSAGRPLRDAGITGSAVRAVLPRAAEPAAGEVDADALSAIGIDYESVRAAVDDTFGAGALAAAPDRHSAERRARPRFTREAKRTLELSLRVARELRHNRLLPGHLLLGLLRLDDADVSRVIDACNVSVGDLSAAVLVRLSAAA